jgi:hypothetical protein
MGTHVYQSDYKQSLLSLLCRLLAKKSNTTTFIARLASRMVSFASSYCNNAKNCRQYVPLRFSLNKRNKSFLFKNNIILRTPDSPEKSGNNHQDQHVHYPQCQLNNSGACGRDLGRVNLVAMWIIYQIALACWQSKKRCLIVSLQLQKQHF